jgi:hypothetical protein
MRSRLESAAIVVVLIAAAACTGTGDPAPTTAPLLTTTSAGATADVMAETVRAFEEALWSGDIDTALSLTTERFVYRYPFEVMGREELRAAFGHDEGHESGGEIRIETTEFETDGNVISWTSLRYFPGSVGQAAAMSAMLDGGLIEEITETGALTNAEDAIGCEDSFPYSWHGDYGPEAVGVSDDPVAATIDGFPLAVDGIAFEEAGLGVEAPMSGGQGPVVRASHDGYTVGFVFLTERPNGTLLVDAVTACEGFLEPAFEEEHEDFEESEEFEEPVDVYEERELVVDASGAAASGGTPSPDVEGASPGDDGEGPMPLGTISTLPDTVRLDFLSELCQGEVCFRDAHFVDPENPEAGSGSFTSNTPFHVRHGFVNENDESLGDGFDLVLYVASLDEAGEIGGSAAEWERYTSDYVIRGTTDACGPTYRSQTGPVTCEWFVHEFNKGLPRGRHALWAFWEAPCRAWLDYGFTDSCADPDEVTAMMSSGVDSPFGDFEPEYFEAGQEP